MQKLSKAIISVLAGLYLPLLATDNVTCVFAHGLGGNWQQALCYSENNEHNGYRLTNPLNWHIMKEPIHSFNFPHVNEDFSTNQQVSLGQHIEIGRLKSEHDTLTTDTVLVGLSMGASTIINYASAHYTPRIKALVLESPFDAIENVVKFKTQSFSWIPGSYSLGTSFMNSRFMYPLYDKNGIKPLTSINKLDKNLPIIFIHSQTDSLIPISCSRHLYCHLKKAGHTHVYLLELNDGNHANYFSGSDAQKYQNVVHAFYKKYNLPHDEQLARLGQPLLAQCQPTVREVSAR